ncbi:MAG: DUF4198 domain-containing protein [Planctomycetaceae bacterium]|nr:MAG: DUF4198 domain-containing protein [Planctomycetaceae bacterium]
MFTKTFLRSVLTHFTILVPILGVTSAHGHDTWVEVNTSEVRPGNLVHVDLKLGNHGNDHRDFKLHSLITLDHASLSVVDPGGSETDLIPDLRPTAYEPKQGYWTGRFHPKKPGLHAVAHQLDLLHGTTRAVKSAKTYFLVGEPDGKTAIHSQPLGHALEIVPLTHPVAETAVEKPFRLRVLFNGVPLAEARVTSIPRGEELAEGFDSRFERLTDANGEAEFLPSEANLYLFVVHLRKPDEAGEGFDGTAYGAALTVSIPNTPLY